MSRPARLLVLLLLALVGPRAVVAQSGDTSSDLEGRLADATGVDRLRILARLTEAYRSAYPLRAVALADEAILMPDTVAAPEALVTALNESAWALMELGRYSEATDRAMRGQATAEARGLRAGAARAKNNLGVIRRRTGDFGVALDCFRQALEIYRELGDEAAEATELNNLSVVLGFDLGDYDRALENQLASMRIRERMGDQHGMLQSFNSLGVLYLNLGDAQRAKEYLDRALEGWRDSGMRPRVAATLNNLADVYVALGDLPGALSKQEEALSLREELGSRPGVAFSEESIGNILMGMGRLSDAGVHLRRALAIREELGERKNTAASLVSLARLHRTAKEFDSAEANAQAAASLADSLNALDVQRAAFEELWHLREERGDYPGALEAFRRWNALDDSLFNANRAQRIAALDSEYRSEQQQREIERLRAETQLAVSTAQRRGALLLAVLLLGLVVALLYGRHVSKRLQGDLKQQVEERTQALQDANARLQDLSLTDLLTGLRNRRYLFQTVESDLAVALRAHRDAEREGVPVEGADVVFYLLDLDDFKSVNDDFGHAAGDRVLEQVARVLEQTCRASDVVVRWGGEEFLILSRGVDRAGAAVFAQRVRDAIRDHVFVAGEGLTLRRTCSVGFAPYPFVPRDPRAVSWDQVVGMADQAAYIAKRSGRDAWVGIMATDDTPPELVRGDAATVAMMTTEGVLEVLTSLFREGRKLVLEEDASTRRNA